MHPDELRRQAITALFSDSVISKLVALKGGNALRLVYGQTRTSLDIDFSLRSDFDEVSFRLHLDSSLRNHFRALGYPVVSLKVQSRPQRGPNTFGYGLELRLVEEHVYEKNKSDADKLRVLASGCKYFVEIEFSKDEYLGSVRTVDWDIPVIVYTHEAITIEKLRALCQQLPVYEHRKKKTARARDFYDICAALDGGVDLFTDDCLRIAREVFSTKVVDLNLLLKLSGESEREHHRVDWKSVVDSVPADTLKSFDYYFERVGGLARDLHAHWNI